MMEQIKDRGHQETPPAIATDGKGAYREAMVETWGKVPPYKGYGLPPGRKQPLEGWQYVQVVKHREGSKGRHQSHLRRRKMVAGLTDHIWTIKELFMGGRTAQEINLNRVDHPNLGQQQKLFNIFREEYNNVRSHEGIEMRTPAELYSPSKIPMPVVVPDLIYPAHYETRLVSRNGGFRWRDRWVCVSTTCAGHRVGLEEIGDGVWDVFLGPVKLGAVS